MEAHNHILLDAAKMDGYIYLAREMNEEHSCLYEGDSEVLLGSSAPWLFELDEYTEFSDWLAENAPDNSWGVIINSQAETEVLNHHFRKFLIIHTDAGRELYFRFYDPRVLGEFLPTCDSEQLQEFFGPVDSYVLENEEGNMLQFSLDGPALIRKKLNMKLEEFLLTGLDNETNSIEYLEAKDEKQKGEENRWEF